MELSNEVATDKAYFDAIGRCHNQVVGKHFFHALARRDISDWNPRSIPDTDLKRELKLNFVPSAIKFVIDVLKGEIDTVKFGEDKKLKIHTNILYREFNIWRENKGIAEQLSEQTFSKNLNKIIKSKQMRINGHNKFGFEFDFDATINSIKTYLKMPDADILNLE